MLTLSERLDDEGEAEKAEEKAIQLLEAGEDTAVTLKAAKEALDFIAFLVECPVIVPRVDAIGFGWDDRNHLEGKHELASFIAFVSAIHDHGHAGKGTQAAKQFAAFRCIVGVTRREAKVALLSTATIWNVGVSPELRKFRPEGERSLKFRNADDTLKMRQARFRVAPEPRKCPR